MPSIKQADLDELNSRVSTAEIDRDRQRTQSAQNAAQIVTFDSILDKIVRAANGQPLIDSPNAVYGNYWGGTVSALDPNYKPSKGERAEREIANLNERVVDLERRLAAVNAVGLCT